MKNVFLVLCTMFALSTVTLAQEAPAKAKAPAKEMKGKGKGKVGGEQGKPKMGANLGLSPEQQTNFEAVNKAHQEAVMKVQKDASLKPDAKKAQIDALKTKYEADVQGVMNADQYAKWSEGRAKRAEKKEGDKMNKPHGAQHKKEGQKGKAKSDKAAPQGETKPN